MEEKNKKKSATGRTGKTVAIKKCGSKVKEQMSKVKEIFNNTDVGKVLGRNLLDYNPKILKKVKEK